MKIFPIFLILTGLSLLVFLIWPIVSWQFFVAPQLSGGQFLDPLPDSGNTSPVASDTADTIKTVSQVLPQRNNLSKLRQYPLWSPDLKEFFLTIDKLNISNAKVKVSEEKFDESLAQLAGSALPGEKGNMVIVGHSMLPQFFSPKNYRTIFSTLSDLEMGDEIIIQVNGIEYRYTVESLKIVDPNNIEALFSLSDGRFLTLLTCVPPGLNTQRLFVTASLRGIQ